MEQLGIVREDEYLARLGGAAPGIVESELRNLLSLVTVTETCFFRDAAQFRLLREHIVPTLMAERSRRRDASTRIRIWSAGCSSGEEAYSIAITLDAMGMFRNRPDWTIEIIGTDLNTQALEKARRGVYSARAVRNVEGAMLERYFTRTDGGFALSESIKARVTFEFGNLTQTPMPSTGPQDIVFCKNVSIYFRSDVTRKLIAGLRDTLAPGGYLLLGHAESLWQISDGFELVEHDRAFCYRKSENVAASPTVRLKDATVRLKGATVRLKPDPTYGDPTYGGKDASQYVGSGFSRTARARRKTDTTDSTGEYDLCLSAFRAGDWDIAEAALLALVAACPTFVPGLLLLGGLYVHRGRLNEGMAQADAVLAVNDLEPRAHLLVGMIAARQQRHDEALTSLRRALYLDDSLALGHFWLGNLYRDRGDVARARHEYENVVADWENRTLQFTEEFASDLTAEQLVEFCREAVNGRRKTVNGKP